MDHSMLERLLREAGVPELLDVLVERLGPTDLQSLLLEVYRRRASTITPSQLLERYERDRFVRPSRATLEALTDFDRLIWSQLSDAYTAIELSPVCPLGTNAAIATVDQNKVLTTLRNTEVVADATNVLALECASRRRLLHTDRQNRERVRLCTSHRVVRGQAYKVEGALPHFRLLALCVAGRDEGSFRFETSTLLEQIGFYLRVLREASQFGYPAHHFRVAITDLEQGRREQVLTEQVLSPLAANHSDILCELDPNRETGRGYYVGACFHIYATNLLGTEMELIDGGFTTWTQQLLSNAKERLLISGLGTERFLNHFGTSKPGL
ncbi:hypothetical protein [Tengunoibacter tsumagoiensis]|uniref:Uncharacterized protein n=1 Tax=Tengunoibacter tsumagoiensis TaxID=2014871 RepID=A0A402A8I9_9CHLR|nr:hypothetical protein [Tengunoibacter tsumagoiensis]GCE15453.1 hypothetical protein KTT_53120 [Tengunoibacter tsumagoiensis]